LSGASMASKASGLHPINDVPRRIDRAVPDQPKETNNFARAPCRREHAVQAAA
jgi:hypothetical protein